METVTVLAFFFFKKVAYSCSIIKDSKTPKFGRTEAEKLAKRVTKNDNIWNYITLQITSRYCL